MPRRFSREFMRRAFELRNEGAGYEAIRRVIKEELGRDYSIRSIEEAVRQYRQEMDCSVCLDGLSIEFVRKRVSEPDISIVCVADSHISSAEKAGALVSLIQSVAEKYRNPHFLFLGDIIQLDISKPGNPFRKDPMEEMTELAKVISTFASATIGVISGNHEKRLNKTAGIDPMKLFCTLYSVPYLGSAGLIRLEFPWGARTIYAIHGTGGGKKIGAKATKLEDLVQVVSADIYIHAHTHEFIQFYRDRIEHGTHLPRINRLLFANVPSLQPYADYVAERGYPIAANGIAVLRVSRHGSSFLLTHPEKQGA